MTEKAKPAASPLIGSKTVDPAIQLYVLQQLHEQLKSVHEVEVRVLRDQLTDLRAQLADARARTAPPRAPYDETEETEPEADSKGKGDKENPLRRTNPVQWVLDSLEEVVPLSNEQARAGIRNWVSRQIRLRGQGSLDDILAEAVQGDITDEETEESEE